MIITRVATFALRIPFNSRRVRGLCPGPGGPGQLLLKVTTDGGLGG